MMNIVLEFILVSDVRRRTRWALEPEFKTRMNYELYHTW